MAGASVTLNRSKELAFSLHHSQGGWLPLVWEVLFLVIIEILLRM